MHRWQPVPVSLWRLLPGTAVAARMAFVEPGGYKRLLVVVKQTAYSMYRQMKAQGSAPLALQWQSLAARDRSHRACVKELGALLRKTGCATTFVNRQELHHNHLEGVDLVIAVGGDGTALSASHFLRDDVALLAINSDPEAPSEIGEEDRTNPAPTPDMRRSTGALCACNRYNMHQVVPEVLVKAREPKTRSRLRVHVKAAYNDTLLPPALNDVLVAHPSPAAVSRLYISGECQGKRFDMNSWNSGVWLCTATGSTAAMSSAGGVAMDPLSRDMQWRIREQLDSSAPQAPCSGIVEPGGQIFIRWNSQVGGVYVDGHYVHHSLELGDEVTVSADARPLYVFHP
uniref:NAD(+) kinase n=1 Tax=Rhizochromulina marina TaxID=1034831 RepID=A0A7S2RG17_9STRA